MRFGTVTLHAGFNEGAILQSLALQRAISELRPGADVEIVDHRYPVLMEKAYGPADNDRKKALQDFADHRLPVSPRRFYSADRHPTFDYIRSRYDAIVVGSDEVWKIAFQRRLKGLLRLQTDPYAPAFPNVFWPDRSIGIPKIAYAASAGEKTDWLSMSPRMRRKIAGILGGFGAIGVRDERTRAFALWADQSLAGKIEWTPDPTLICDLTNDAAPDDLRARLAAWGVDFNRPRLLLIAGEHPAYAAACALLKTRGYQIVSVSDRNPYADIDLTGAAIGPLDWAGLARHFDACLSERMHGGIFAVLNGCPLICADRRRPTMGFPTKNHALSDMLGLSHRYVSVNEAGGQSRLLEMCSTLQNLPYDRAAIGERLAELRRIGRDFLDRSLPGKHP